MADDGAGLWAAVLARDRAADGCFVYAVQSTRVYCRPSCPSRRPRRDRVEFFPSPSIAVEHGYRACRRCHPDRDPSGTPATARVQRVCEAVALAPERPWTARQIASVSGANVAQVQRAFRAVLGIAPRDYVAACRRRGFLARLRSGVPVTTAIYDAGYGSSSRVYGGLPLGGMTPATYGRGGAGASIDWVTMRSPVGVILVAATRRGACFVEVGSSRKELLEALRREFPHATIAGRPTVRRQAWMAAVEALANGQPAAGDLSADIRGTAFQWRVWRALQAIRPGTTITYAELAQRLGTPRAARGVARACATNPLAIVVPCHRVVGSDGSLRGYRWGLAVKQGLIDRERARKAAT